MAIELIGATSGVKADVDAVEQLKVVTSSDGSEVGYAAILARSDEGDFTGNTVNIPIEGDKDYRLRVGVDSMKFRATFDGTALDSANWSSNVTTMTTAVASGYATLNNSALTTINTSARITSYRTFDISQAFSVYLDVPIMLVAASAGIPNTVWELGFFIATGVAVPTDGVFVRMNATGEFRLVTNFNGSETQSAPINLAAVLDDGLPILEPNTDRQMVLEVSSHTVRLWMNDILITTLEQPSGVPTFSFSQSLPASFRLYNSAIAPTTATQIKLGTITVSEGGRCNPLAFHEQCAMSGWGAYQGQSGGTAGQTANWANSTEPVNATLSNTAAGYTTLGGQWSFVAPAGAVTDFALFAYTVPAVAVGANNKNMLIRKVRVDTINVGAAVATTATVLQWAIAVGSTAVSLATAEGATTKAPRRVPLGMQTFQVGAGIGSQATVINLDFSESPLLAEPGTIVHIIVRVPIGTATASQVLRGTVTIKGHNG